MSTEVALVIANIIPIDLMIKETSQIYQIKKNIEEYERVQRPIKHYLQPHPASRIGTINSQEIADIKVYTNGLKLKNDGGVGSGAVIMNNDVQIETIGAKLDNKCSVFQSKLFAILTSLRHISSSLQNGGNEIANICDDRVATRGYANISIYSNSKSSIRVSQNKSYNQIIFDINVIVETLKEKHINIALEWVRGHLGIKVNEIVDKVAKEYAESQRSLDYDLLPISVIKTELRHKTYDEWNKRWIKSTKGSITRLYFPTITDRLKCQDLQINYKLTQFLTAHGKFRAYCHRFKINTTPKCDCEKSEETPEHIIMECDKYFNQRQPLVKEAHSLGLEWPTTLQNIIMFKRLRIEFLNFLTKV